MMKPVEAILFDMGGTLRRRLPCTAGEKLAAVGGILERIGSEAAPAEFAEVLSARDREYQAWAQRELVELNASDLWTRWMLPDMPAELVEPLALELNALWRTTRGRHVIFAETQETILTLYRRGYRLGLVSNTTSSTEAPRVLEDWKLGGCFDTVVLSCVFGRRKPDPQILLEASRRMGVDPVACAYIGNSTDRDVPAARRAGFSRTVILRDPQNPAASAQDPDLLPDHFVDKLNELLDLFPAPPPARHRRRADPVYNASMSSMWGVKKFADLNDFLIASRRLGFARVELNHQVSAEVLTGMDLDGTRFSSIHEPCPVLTSAEDLKKRDLLISSPDEARRHQGVEGIRRSIDLARRVNAGVVVVHCGQIQADSAFENELRAMFELGLYGTPEYMEKKQRFAELRAGRAAACLEAVKRSLHELMEYAAPHGIRLGLENRYHYLDLPSLDEMGELLALAGPERLGFMYDIGHATALDRLGFYPWEDWLKRYGDRVLGMHIHDVTGITDHAAPGLGQLDFRSLAAWLPGDAIRTLELHPRNTPEQVRTALRILEDAGCIHRIH